MLDGISVCDKCFMFVLPDKYCFYGNMQQNSWHRCNKFIQAQGDVMWVDEEMVAGVDPWWRARTVSMQQLEEN